MAIMIRKHLNKYAIAALRIVYYNRSMTKQDIASVKYLDFIDFLAVIKSQLVQQGKALYQSCYRIQNSENVKYLLQVVLVDLDSVI